MGKIVSIHGVKGLIKVELYNTDSENLKNYSNNLYIDNLQINLEKKFTKGKLTICKITSYESREEIIRFVGKEIWVEENSLEKSLTNTFIEIL